MPLAPPLIFVLCGFVMLAPLASGCGSDGSGSGYGARDSTEGPATATATTPEAPPGATARACEGTVAGVTDLRVTGIGCDAGDAVAASWKEEPSCAAPADASRFSCAVPNGYRCIGASAGRGITVSCARPGASVAFIASALKS